MKAIINVKCPECGGYLEIDVRRERVLSHKMSLDDEESERDKAELFDEVVKKVKAKSSEAEDKFEKAQLNERNKNKRLEDLFGEVKKKVAEEMEKDPSEREPNPRDLFWD